MTITLPTNKIYLPRAGKLHFSDWSTWNGGRGKSTYIKRFFKGEDNLNTKAIQFGSHLMYLMEFEPEHELVKDIPRHSHIEYDLECLLGGEIPIETHPDSVDIDNTLGVYEYKTAMAHRSWNSRMVYKQQQISFYQMCIRELKNGDWNPNDNFIVEVPTERQKQVEIDGVEWETTGPDKFIDISREKQPDGSYTPVKLHQRVVTKAEIDKLQDEVISTAREISELYREYLEDELNKIVWLKTKKK